MATDPDPAQSGAPLNAPQRTAVAVALQGVEQALDTIEELLAAGPPEDKLVQVALDLPAWRRAEVSAAVRRARQTLRELVAAWQPPARRLDGRNVIASQLTAAWVGLDDARPEKLTRYGSVDPSLDRILTPGLERLIEEIEAMRSLALEP